MKYLVRYKTRSGKSGFMEHESLMGAKIDAKSLRNDPYYKDVDILTSKGRVYKPIQSKRQAFAVPW